MNRTITFKIFIIFTFLVALWCAGILAAPLLMRAGFHDGADIVYSAYSRVCHQSDARSFHIEGEKFGVCIRCSAIYFGFLVGLLLMPFFGALNRMRFPRPALLIAVILPMAIDAVFNDAGLHASTTVTRMATGFLFGSVMPWCILPLFVEACLQLHKKKKIPLPDSGV